MLAALALASLGAGPPILRSGHSQPLYLSPAQASALSELRAGPVVASRAAALVDRRSGAVLWGKAEAEPLPMASTTKLMTVLVALESLPPDLVVAAPAAALIGNASMGLQAGAQVRVETLIYGALLPSGNDAAMTLALAAAGSEQAFVARMNQRAAEWGLTATHFQNPHGLDAAGHLSSALDLAALGRRALDQPLVARAVAAPQVSLEGYHLASTNELLTRYRGAYGVKTGTTDLAGAVLIAAAARGSGDAIAVVMNSPDRFAEAARLLDFYFRHWQWVEFRLDHDALNRVAAPGGAVYLLRSAPRPLLLARWQVGQARTLRRVWFEPDGRPAGVYQVWLGEQLLAEAPVEFIPLAQSRPVLTGAETPSPP